MITLNYYALNWDFETKNKFLRLHFSITNREKYGKLMLIDVKYHKANI